MMKANAKSPKAVRVGDRVQVTTGPFKFRAVVIEDRGPVGAKGRRILRVQTLDKNVEARQTFEVPLAEVTSTGARSSRA